jgi:hypothetical protein
MRSRYLIYSVLAAVLCAPAAFAISTRAEFDAQVGATITKLNQEAIDLDGVNLLTQLVQREYGTPSGELKWALENGFSWGEIAAFAYIRATTGQSFAELSGSDVRKDFWGYIEKIGMSSDKMADSLDRFFKRAEKERNSRIFDRMRSNRTVNRVPDLGSGFGLFQEALDFRRLEVTRPTKVHSVGPGALKGER